VCLINRPPYWCPIAAKPLPLPSADAALAYFWVQKSTRAIGYSGGTGARYHPGLQPSPYGEALCDPLSAQTTEARAAQVNGGLPGLASGRPSPDHQTSSGVIILGPHAPALTYPGSLEAPTPQALLHHRLLRIAQRWATAYWV